MTEGAQKAMVVDMVPKEWQGRALGAFQMAVGVAALSATAAFGLLYRESGRAPPLARAPPSPS